jgi:hypothetical protein
MRGWYGEYELPGVHSEAFPEQDEKSDGAGGAVGNGPEGTTIPMTSLVLLRKLRRISNFCGRKPAGVGR